MIEILRACLMEIKFFYLWHLQGKNKEGSKKVPAIAEHVDNRKKATPRSQSSENIKPSVQELAARAASLAMAEVSKNIKAPKSAYEFENSWRSFSGDRTLQNQLLKVQNTTCRQT